jgi:hypothetical protein
VHVHQQVVHEARHRKLSKHLFKRLGGSLVRDYFCNEEHSGATLVSIHSTSSRPGPVQSTSSSGWPAAGSSPSNSCSGSSWE